MNYFFLKTGTEYKSILCKYVSFIKGDGDYIKIFYTDGSNLRIHFSLKKFMDKNVPNFLQVHKSYIVNVDNIIDFELDSIHVVGNYIPLSDFYRQNFLQKIVIINE